MAKKSKIKTPDWILKGEDDESPRKKKGKTFKIRRCPKCNSDKVNVVLNRNEGNPSTGGEWECKNCGWKGKDIREEELTEEQFMKYLDERGEEVA